MADCSYCQTPTKWAEELEDGSVLCPACRAALFFTRHLTLTGDFGGQPFVLMPWLDTVVRDLFGTLDDDGMRRYKDVYLEVPTGNCKTTFCAGLVLCFLAQCEAGTEIYSAATARDQASITFRMAQQMVLQSPALDRLLTVLPSTRRILRRDDPTSFYCAISADGDVHDGINPSFVVRDELHRWRNRKALELNEVLERKIVKRKNPLIVDITTAGDMDESPLCWRRHEYTRQIQEGVFEDRRFYGRIFAADPKRIECEPDYWKSREARVAANPSHEDNGGYVKDSVLADLCLKAQNDPRVRCEYLRYHLNYWGQTDESVIDMVKWVACGGGVDLRTWGEYDVDRLIREWNLRGKRCFVGVDASWSTDLTSVAAVFPPEGSEPWTILPFFWLAEGQSDRRERLDKMPYAMWARQGFIDFTPGDSIDLSYIKDKILWIANTFDLQEVCYDPWGFKQTANDLARFGLTCVDVRQAYGSLSEATKALLGWYADAKLRHGNHPILNWNARCLALKGDDKDNVQPAKPERAKSSKRIDGISAAITALARARLLEETTMSYTGLRAVG